jgi:tRNA(His) 5'-end guanylyltransferase
MNTILKTIIDLDYLNGNKTFNSDEIGSIISDFELPFGTQDKINVVFSAASTSEFVPLVKISDNDVIFQF